MHVIAAVFKRNFVGYLSGIIGYLFMVVFLVAAAFAAFNDQFFTNNLANLDQLTLWFPLLLVALIPAITMSSWADERRFGTDEILFTLPATDLQILLGKYLAVLAVYSVTLLFGGGIVIALCVMRAGLPDVGLVFSSFVGYWFAGAALLAAGLVASASSKSPTVAYLLGLFLGGLPVLLHYSSSSIANYSVAAHLRDFGLGLVALESVLYFASVALLMLFMNYVLITGRFWSTGPGRAAMLVGVSVAVMLPLIAWFATYGDAQHISSFLDWFADRIPTLEAAENRPAVRAGILTVILLLGYGGWALLSLGVMKDRINPAVGLGAGAAIAALMLLSYCLPAVVAPIATRLGIVAVLSAGVLVAGACNSESREWRSALLYATEFLALGVMVFSLNQAATALNWRLDVTQEQLYSLSKSTRQTLNELKKSKPEDQQEIRIHAFISPNVPKQYAGVRNTLMGLLRSYHGWGNVVVELKETRPLTPEAAEAKRFGIEPQGLRSEEAGRVVTNQVFMGVAIASRDQEVVIPFFDLGTPVEYELTRSIATLTRSKRKKLGVLRTDAAISGGFNMQTFSRNPEWRLFIELKKQYDVSEVSPAELKTKSFDVLVAVMPSTLTAEELPNLVEYVEAGHPTLIVDDPFPLFFPHLSPRQPKPSPGGPMARMQQPPQQKADGGSLKPLLDALDLDWTLGETIWDPYNPHPELNETAEAIDVLFIDANSAPHHVFSQESPITKGMQQLLMLYPGSLRVKEDSPLVHEKLLRTSKRANVREWSEYVKESPQNPFSGDGGGPIPQYFLDPVLPNEDGVVYMPACHVTSKPGAKRSINAIVIADLDMITDQFFQLRDRDWNSLELDNIALVLNSIDVLADDLTNVALRTRRSVHRTLTSVDNARRRVYDEKSRITREARNASKKQIEEIEKRYEERVAELKKRKDLSPSLKQDQLKQLQFDKTIRSAIEEAQIKERTDETVEKAKEQSRADILWIEAFFRWSAVLLTPVPVIILGAFVALRRMADERQGINTDRVVKPKK